MIVVLSSQSAPPRVNSVCVRSACREASQRSNKTLFPNYGLSDVHSTAALEPHLKLVWLVPPEVRRPQFMNAKRVYVEESVSWSEWKLGRWFALAGGNADTDL